jgi:hypothetical protein
MANSRISIAAIVGVALLSGIAWYRASQANTRNVEEHESLLARLDGLEKRLQAETTRANAAETESAALLKAIDEARNVRVAVPTPAAVRPAPATEAPRPGVSTKAPDGWHKNGLRPEAYTVGVDSNQMLNGLPSAYARSTEATADAFGGMMQTISAEAYRGKRVQLSGWMKTKDANDGGGHLWLRIDGQESGKVLEFDNMNKRAPTGTTDWQRYSVVLDVAAQARAIAYGFFIQGKGQVWVNNSKVEVVGSETPNTNMMTGQPALPKQPANPTFQ